MIRKAVLVWSYFVGLILYPSYLSAQEPPVETPKLLFDGKTFTLPLESPVLQKRQIADTLLVGMPIEAYIEPLNLKLSEYKFALPNTPKYVCDVELEAGTHIREGEVNPLEGWGSGGGTQYDLIGQRIGNFKNERLLEGN